MIEAVAIVAQAAVAETGESALSAAGAYVLVAFAVLLVIILVSR